MNNINLQAIILAAGNSSRFNTSKSKLSYKICGQEMILYPVKLFTELKIPFSLVLGYQKDFILSILKEKNFNVSYSTQNQPKGTGHALLTSKNLWNTENILIMNGDMPLVEKSIIENLTHKHHESNATISFITSHNPEPSASYGRVIKENKTTKIVEACDFDDDPNKFCCVNAGIYLVKRSFLAKYLNQIELHNKTKEFFITDLVYLANKNNYKISTVNAPLDSVRGVNSLKELWIVEQIKRSEIINNWMNNGVRFLAPQTNHIDINVKIKPDTYIGTGVQLKNSTEIGSNCFIDSFSIIDGSKINDNVKIKSHSVIENSIIENNSEIGPFAHIQKQTIIQKESKVGNFVEIKESSIGEKSKIKHLAYIGNTELGSNVNVGAGTVTCNYNGFEKNKTIIKNNTFIGANSSLVAPLEIGNNAVVAAGSVITKNVNPNDLAIGRSRQINKENYALKLKEKCKIKKNKKNFAIKQNHNNISETL